MEHIVNNCPKHSCREGYFDSSPSGGVFEAVMGDRIIAFLNLLNSGALYCSQCNQKFAFLFLR